MPPRLVVCHCCSCGCVALAVCPTCERAQLHRLVLLRGLVHAPHPADGAIEALIDSYHADSFDREAAAAPGRDS